MITHLDEFEKIAEWLENNLRAGHGRLVENVRFNQMDYYDPLAAKVCLHSKGFKGRTPLSYDGREMYPLEEDLVTGFYGNLILEQVATVNDSYDDRCYGDLFEGTGIPIHQINQSYFNGGGRMTCRWYMDDVVIQEDGTAITETEPRREIVEATNAYAYRIFMFAEDWPDLTDSFRVRKLLTT